MNGSAQIVRANESINMLEKFTPGGGVGVWGGQGKAWGGGTGHYCGTKERSLFTSYFFISHYTSAGRFVITRAIIIARSGEGGARTRERKKTEKIPLRELPKKSPRVRRPRLAEHAEHAESRGQGSRAVASSGLALSLSLSLSLSRRDKLGDTALIAGGDSVRSIGHGYGSGGRSMGPVEVQDCSG